MDDPHTNEALDALANLFLTGADEPSRAAPRPAKFHGNVAAASEPFDPLDGPKPIRLPPTIRPRRGAIDRTFEDETSGEGPSASAAETSAPQPRRRDPFLRRDAATLSAQAVFLGHLPSLGGPWLTQYAHFLALQHGPVLVLHVDDYKIDLEVVSPRAGTSAPEPAGADLSYDDQPIPFNAEIAAKTQSATPQRPRQPELIERLSRLIEAGGADRTHLLVHLCDATSPRALRRAVDLQEWTIVTGAFDAAVVGAYQLLKQLVEDGSQLLSRQPLGSVPPNKPTTGMIAPAVGLMVMGNDQGRSAGIAKRVSEAAAPFLRTPVRMIGWQKQIVPVDVRAVGTFDNPVDRDDPTDPGRTWRQLVEFIRERGAEPKDAATAVEATEDRRPTAQDYREALGLNQPTVAVDGPDTESEPAAAAEPEPVGKVKDRTPSAETDSALDLTSFLRHASGQDVGGVALQARCPRHPQTQIMLDQHGRLHLLRRHASGPTVPVGDSLRAAIVDLIEARTWVKEHLALLQLSHRQCRFDTAAKPVLHLFTDQAKTAAMLVGRLGTFVRLHLLQQVRVGDGSTWFCTELN